LEKPHFTSEEILNGEVLLVDKPLDWTSFDVVNKIRWKLKKQLGIKKIKVGHAGTLDPKATGLLILCTGKATKRISEIQDAPKEYRAQIKLGFETVSHDTEQPEIHPKDISHLTEQNVLEVLKKFEGEIQQNPPVFSAVKIEGKRAYELAREGKQVETKTRTVQINYIKEIEIDFPFVSFLVGCSKGTYIRSLAHDIGKELSVGAYLTQLRRTKIGTYSVENATSEYLEDEYKFVL